MRTSEYQNIVAVLATRSNVLVRIKLEDVTHDAALAQSANEIAVLCHCGVGSTTRDTIIDGVKNADDSVTCMMCIARSL